MKIILIFISSIPLKKLQKMAPKAPSKTFKMNTIKPALPRLVADRQLNPIYDLSYTKYMAVIASRTNKKLYTLPPIQNKA